MMEGQCLIGKCLGPPPLGPVELGCFPKTPVKQNFVDGGLYPSKVCVTRNEIHPLPTLEGNTTLSPAQAQGAG